MAPGLPTQLDNNAVYTDYTRTPIIYVSNCSFSGSHRNEEPSYYQLRMLAREFGRFLDNSYAELLSRLNYDPSVDGVRTKKERYDQLITQVRSLWARHVRFDLRQPCWRAGRWRSLTA